MNSLGLEYASSSDEDDQVGVSTPALAVDPVSPAQAPAAPVPISDDAPAEPEATRTPESSVTIPVTSGEGAPKDDDELEEMLQRAGIPSAAAPLESDSETQQRVARFLRVQQERGQDFQTTLQDKKEVRNPYILEKVVEYFGIDELQSNFSKEVFDPHGLPLHEFADALALEQKKRADARHLRQVQQQGANPRQLHFVSSDPSSRG